MPSFSIKKRKIVVLSPSIKVRSHFLVTMSQSISFAKCLSSNLWAFVRDYCVFGIVCIMGEEDTWLFA